jgi:hypothetical protein
LAPILTSFSRNVVSDHVLTVRGSTHLHGSRAGPRLVKC